MFWIKTAAASAAVEIPLVKDQFDLIQWDFSSYTIHIRVVKAFNLSSFVLFYESTKQVVPIII